MRATLTGCMNGKDDSRRPTRCPEVSCLRSELASSHASDNGTRSSGYLPDGIIAICTTGVLQPYRCWYRACYRPTRQQRQCQSQWQWQWQLSILLCSSTPLGGVRARTRLTNVTTYQKYYNFGGCTQLPLSSWYQAMEEQTVADDVLDCLVLHNSIKVELFGELMRKSTSSPDKHLAFNHQPGCH